MTTRKTRSGRPIAHSSDKLYALIDANRQDDQIELAELVNRADDDPNDILDYAISKDAHHAVWAILRYRAGMLNQPRAFRALIPFLPRVPAVYRDRLDMQARFMGRIARRLGYQMIQLIDQDQALATQLFDALHRERHRDHKVIDPAIWAKLSPGLQRALKLTLTATVIMGVDSGDHVMNWWTRIDVAELARRFEPTPDKILNLGRVLNGQDGFPLLVAFAKKATSASFVGPIASIEPKWTRPLGEPEYIHQPRWFCPGDEDFGQTTVSQGVGLIEASVDVYRQQMADVFQSVLPGTSGLSHFVATLVI